MLIGLSHGNLKKLFRSVWRHKATLPVDITFHGIKMRCQLETNNIENKLVFSSKVREKEELQLLDSFLQDGGVFIDIGANVGYYSLMAAALGASKVLAFEPNETVRKRFDFNVTANNLEQTIHSFPCALGEKDCVLPLAVSNDDLGAGTLISKEVSAENTIPVAVKRIDAILQQNGVTQIRALKIDVEGYECEALTPLLYGPSSLYPSLLIIEHVHKHLWSTDIVQSFIQRGYTVLGKNRSNTFLQFFQLD